MNETFSIIIYVLLAILLIVSIIFIIKLMHTLSKVDALVDDVTYKSSKLNGIFDIVDKSTETLTLLGEKFISFISGTVVGFFTKKNRKGEGNE